MRQLAETTERGVEVGDELRELDRVTLQGEVLLEIAAGAEGAPGPGEEKRPHRRVVLDGADGRRPSASSIVRSIALSVSGRLRETMAA